MADGSGPVVSADWIRCKPWIEKALERGGSLYGIDDVERMIFDGQAWFSHGENCAAVVRIIGTKKKALEYWLLGAAPNHGLGELLNVMQPIIEKWAKSMGCEMAVGLFGKRRAGWVRVLRTHGYSPLWTALSKEI